MTSLQLQVAAIMAVALFSVNTADAAAGDCAFASVPTIMALEACMTAAGDNATEQAACTDGLADACPPCIEAAGEEGALACFPASSAGDCTDADYPTLEAMDDCTTTAGDDDDAQAACMAALSNACLVCTMSGGENPMSCFADGAAGDCAGADLTAMTTKDTCLMSSPSPSPEAVAACETAMLDAMGAKCMICIGQKDAAATAENPADHFACFAPAAAGDCGSADLTAMTTMDTCSTAAGDDAGEAAACSAAMSAALTPKCTVCTASNAAAATAENPANPMACFDLAAMATTECCKEGGGLDDADKVGASVECLTAAVMILGAADLEPPEADCGDDPTPTTIAAACKAWIKPNILGAGKECPAPAPEGQGTPSLGLASTSSVPFAASVALVLVALRLH